MNADIDSLSADGAQEPAPEPKQYVVDIASLYDTDERYVIAVTAYGPNDIRNQVNDSHPGFYVRGFHAKCRCGHAEHNSVCSGGASTSTGKFIRCACSVDCMDGPLWDRHAAGDR